VKIWSRIIAGLSCEEYQSDYRSVVVVLGVLSGLEREFGDVYRATCRVVRSRVAQIVRSVGTAILRGQRNPVAQRLKYSSCQDVRVGSLAQVPSLTLNSYRFFGGGFWAFFSRF